VSADRDRDELWDELTSFSDTFTCYSAALATWLAVERGDWADVVDPGLWLALTEEPGLLFGFSHFPPGLRGALGLMRTGAQDAERAVAGVLAEIGRSGRVIVAGDGYHLPWHVAHGRRHVPHWYVLLAAPGGAELLDPFACRNELGLQQATRRPVGESELAALLEGLPGDDPVLALRESLALGDEAGAPDRRRHQWFERGEAGTVPGPVGVQGPEAVLRLAAHFREHGQDPAAYGQSDDIWSIARHRAFVRLHAERTAAATGDEPLVTWVQTHATPLAKRWGHMAPLLMQASLTLASGRAATASVPDALERMAELERAAAVALAPISSTI
jgi:hypothetical protein